MGFLLRTILSFSLIYLPNALSLFIKITASEYLFGIFKLFLTIGTLMMHDVDVHARGIASYPNIPPFHTNFKLTDDLSS